MHTADQYVHCDGDWKVTLANGDVVYGEASGVWPDLGEQPAARKILQLTTKGQGRVVEDNSAQITKMLATRRPSAGVCSVRVPGSAQARTSSPIASPLAALALVVLFVGRRIRHRRRVTGRPPS